MKKFVLVVIGIAIVGLITGCMSIQEMRDKRIADNQGVFNSFPPSIQAQVRRGEIDIGFSMDMVRLAWGVPDDVFSRKTSSGVTTVWRYTKTRIYPYSEHMLIPIRYIDSEGRARISYRSVWINRDTREEYTVARIEFSAGSVSAIEQLNQ